MAERELFLDIVSANPPNHFTKSDRALLAAYCRACILQEIAASELAAAGYLLENGRASGWLTILTASQRAMSTFSRLLRLNPVGRTEMKVIEAREINCDSYYSRLALGCRMKTR